MFKGRSLKYYFYLFLIGLASVTLANESQQLCFSDCEINRLNCNSFPAMLRDQCKRHDVENHARCKQHCSEQKGYYFDSEHQPIAGAFGLNFGKFIKRSSMKPAATGKIMMLETSGFDIFEFESQNTYQPTAIHRVYASKLNQLIGKIEAVEDVVDKPRCQDKSDQILEKIKQQYSLDKHIPRDSRIGRSYILFHGNTKIIISCNRNLYPKGVVTYRLGTAFYNVREYSRATK